MREFRKDPARDRWVILATERALRPYDFKKHLDLPPEESPCFFCGFDEPFRVLSADTGLVRHDTIVETPRHGVFPDAFDGAHYEALVGLYVKRMTELGRQKSARYVFLYKNHLLPRRGGRGIARHAHSEIAALPVVPKKVAEELDTARAYYLRTGDCIYCRMLSGEASLKTRWVAENEAFAAFCPYAAQSPFEMIVLPKAHGADFTEMTAPEKRALAGLLLVLMKKIKKVLNERPFYLALHTLPVRSDALGAREAYHWHIEISPRTFFIAGFEWGGGIFINPVAPEEAARTLREAA